MAILKIARMGNPVLTTPAEMVSREEMETTDFEILISNMIATLRDAGAATLSAPQIHVSKRILVLEITHDMRHDQFPEMPLTVLINPEMTPLGPDYIHHYENCLSMPGLTGRVPRLKAIRVEALERNGEQVAFELEGLMAALLQHGIDHLDGKSLAHRMEDMDTLSYKSEWKKYHYKGPWD